MNAEQTEREPHYEVDETTGEISEVTVGSYGSQETFHVTDVKGAQWVLKTMGREEAAIRAVEQTEAVIHARAILENAAKLKAEHQKKLDFLHYRFDNELGNVAKEALGEGKSRTWQTIHGSVSLRRIPGGLRVADEEKAVAWAHKYYAPAIKTTEAFRITQVPDDVKANLYGADPNYRKEHGFDVIPETEKVIVKTGVEG